MDERNSRHPDEIRVGTSLREAAAEVAAARTAAEAGSPPVRSDKLYFSDWAALCAVLTPRCYELLRHLRRAPAESVRALARALGRDVKWVHADVVARAELGLLQRDPETGSVSTEIDEIASTIRFAA